MDSFLFEMIEFTRLIGCFDVLVFKAFDFK